MQKQIDENTKFFFIHIPKTGGTTLRHILYNYFDSELIYPNKIDLQINGGKYLTQKELIKNPQVLNSKKIIFGHYGYNFKEILGENVVTITFFRNCISRTLSHVNHLRRQGKIEHDSMNSIDFLKNISNIQSKFMGYTPGKDNYNTAKTNLSKIDIICITEYFKESLELINKTLSWNLKSINPLNDHSNNYFNVNNKIISDIIYTNYQDFTLYHSARNIFNKQVNLNCNVSI